MSLLSTLRALFGSPISSKKGATIPYRPIHSRLPASISAPPTGKGDMAKVTESPVAGSGANPSGVYHGWFVTGVVTGYRAFTCLWSGGFPGHHD